MSFIRVKVQYSDGSKGSNVRVMASAGGTTLGEGVTDHSGEITFDHSTNKTVTVYANGHNYGTFKPFGTAHVTLMKS